MNYSTQPAIIMIAPREFTSYYVCDKCNEKIFNDDEVIYLERIHKIYCPKCFEIINESLGTCDSCEERVPYEMLVDVAWKDICKFCIKEFFGYPEEESEEEEEAKVDPKDYKTLDKF